MKFLIVSVLLLTVAAIASGGKMRFPTSAEEEVQYSSDPATLIDSILLQSRQGRALQLRVEGKDPEPLALASDPGFQSVEGKGDAEARSYVATKLCSLGLAKCGESRESEGRHGGHGLAGIQDVTLVQPVALKPIGDPIAAIPLDKPYSHVAGKYGGGGFQDRNYGQQTQGGVLIPSSNSAYSECSCVNINQCNSYDIVRPSQNSNSYPIQSGTGHYPGGVISSGNNNNGAYYGNVGAGIDPRSKRTEIESNSTVVDSEPLTRSVRSDAAEEEIVAETSTNSTRTRREAPFLGSDPRIVNGAFRGCYDDRLVCCRTPIKGPIGGSGSGIPYPTPEYNRPPIQQNYPSQNYPTQTYPTRPATNEYYPSPNFPAPSYAGTGLCGKRNSQGINGRVLTGNGNLGGNSAEFGEYPWQAALLKKDGSNSVFVCGASLIDSRHLLTAAHCIKSHRPEQLRVRLGEWDVNSENEFYPHLELDVAAIAIHPDYYAGNLVNDLAIIKVLGNVELQRYPHISPICLPPPGADFTGNRCFATGWGKDAFGQGGKFQRVLQEVDVPVVAHYECEQRLRRTRLGPEFNLHKGFLCAGGEPEKDACKGDGGGPLSCEVGGVWQLGGVVSWGVGCGNYGVPGVYVKTSSYLDWIRQTIQQ